MLVNVEIFLDPTKPDEPIKQTVDLDPNGNVMVRSNRGSDYARFPDAPNDTLVVRFFPAPQKGPPPPPMAELTSLSPTAISMAAGTSNVTLNGKNFLLAPCQVYVNNIFTPSIRNTDSNITMNYTPDTTGVKKVKVMQGSSFSNELDLTVNA